MRKFIGTLCLTPAVFLGSVGMSESADYQKGLTAAQNGDFATALRECTPLAEQENAPAHMRLNIAASSGDKNATKNRAIVAGWMTPSQLETAQKLAR